MTLTRASDDKNTPPTPPSKRNKVSASAKSMASPGSDGEILDTPQENQSSSRHHRDGRSALSASGHHDRDPTHEADSDAAAIWSGDGGMAVGGVGGR